MATLPDPDQLKDLKMLRHEYDAAMTVACDPDEKWRLYRMVQDLDMCIERVQRSEPQ